MISLSSFLLGALATIILAVIANLLTPDKAQFWAGARDRIGRLQDRIASASEQWTERRARKLLAELQVIEGHRTDPSDLYASSFLALGEAVYNIYLMNIIILLMILMSWLGNYVSRNSDAFYIFLSLMTNFCIGSTFLASMNKSDLPSTYKSAYRASNRGYAQYRQRTERSVSRLLRSREALRTRLLADPDVGGTLRALMPPAEAGPPVPAAAVAPGVPHAVRQP